MNNFITKNKIKIEKRKIKNKKFKKNFFFFFILLPPPSNLKINIKLIKNK